MNKFILLGLVFILGLTACNLPSKDDLLNETKDALWALPILDDEIKMEDLFSAGNDDVEIYSDNEGKVTISYQGEVLRDPADVVFPPIVGFLEFPFPDTLFQLDLSQTGSENSIDSAVFRGDFIRFRYVSSSVEPLTVTVTVDEIRKNGIKLTQTVFFPGSPDGSEVEILGEQLKLEDWSLLGNNNKVTFHYDARTADNEKVEIEGVFFFFNVLKFQYIQGYFPKNARPVIGDFIPINLYNRWIGGTMKFVEPRVELEIENSFGFAVGADFNEMSIETISGEKHDLESTIIDEGIIFNYPSFDEIGEVKYTYLNFDKDNSNLPVIFNDRVAKLFYDIYAISNPLDEPDFLGYMTEDSYYAVQVRVEVPMHLAIDHLQLVDTFDVNFDLTEDYLDTAEIKLILENHFPIDVSTQLYFLSADNIVIDSMFQDGEIFLKGGTVSSPGELKDVEKQTFFIDFSDEKIDNLLKTKRILAKPTFISTPDGQQSIWIYEDYGLKIKMGIKFSLE